MAGNMWADLIKSGLAVNQPTTPTLACFYYATDTGDLSFWTGTAWILVVDGGFGG